MKIIGCDLHARQQTLAMLNTATGEVVRTTLKHEGNNSREFYSGLTRPARVDRSYRIYADGKELPSYVGMIPGEHSSGK